MALHADPINGNAINIWVYTDFHQLLTGVMTDQPVSLKYQPATGTTPALTVYSKAGNALLQGFKPDGTTQAFLVDENGNVTAAGSVTASSVSAPLYGGITSGDDATNHVNGISSQRPSGSARGILIQSWDGTTAHNVMTFGTNGFHAPLYADDNGGIHLPNGGAVMGIKTFSGTGTGTYSHGLNATPGFVGVTSNQANSTMTVGVDTVGSSSVHVNTASAWPFLGVAIIA